MHYGQWMVGNSSENGLYHKVRSTQHLMMTLKIDKIQITGYREWHRQHQGSVGRVVHKDNPVIWNRLKKNT